MAGIDHTAPPRQDQLQPVPVRMAVETALARVAMALQPASDRGPTETIHALRVGIKRWRALLRLLEPIVGDEAAALRTEARDLVRPLGRTRDLQAALDALSDLADGAASETALPRHTRAELGARLDAERRAREAIALSDATRQRISHHLALGRARLKNWPLAPLDADSFAAALAQSYRRARRRLPTSWFDTHPEDIHRLRKAVVTLRYQVEIIEPLWPRIWHTFTSEAQKLRLQLGKCNDLAVLEGFAQDGEPLANWRALLTPLIAQRRHQHLTEARMLAERVFADTPKAFRRRIATLWRAQEPNDPA